MNFLPVPKILKWQHSLTQTYTSDQKILLTSGCSFTATTQQVNTAASWPGFVVDRCRFDYGIDYSYPGAGNDYIGDSILHHFNSVPDTDINRYLTIVMWSGIDRVEKQISDHISQPNLNGIYYHQLSHSERQPFDAEQAQRSYQQMIKVYNYLTKRKINFLFTSYVNLLFPPYIPKRDNTKEFDHWLNKDQLKIIRSLDWAPADPMNYLYEYAFVHDYLNCGDGFHPPVDCNLEWTDKILLPALSQRNLIHEL